MKPSGASSSRIRDQGSNQTESDNDGDADEDDDTAQNESAISETDSDDNKPLRRPNSSSVKNSLNRLDRDRGRKRKMLDRNDRQKNRRERKANRANREANRKLRKRKEINFAEIDKNDESSGDDSDESYICTNCKKKRYSCNWVQCSSCKIWFCAKCVPNVKRYIHDIELVFNCEKCSKTVSKTSKNSIKSKKIIP